jgi:hypothetical protein
VAREIEEIAGDDEQIMPRRPRAQPVQLLKTVVEVGDDEELSFNSRNCQIAAASPNALRHAASQ